MIFANLMITRLGTVTADHVVIAIAVIGVPARTLAEILGK
jgi:hypothetical protein